MEKNPYEVMDLKALRCFHAVARNLSFTRAGVELGISEAAVSQRVKALEGSLGVKLYETHGGRVRLTAAGERTLAFSTSVFDEIAAFEREVIGAEQTAELALAAHDAILGYLLPDAAEAFRRAHPLAKLRLLARPVEETLRLLKSNDIDVGVIPERELPKEFRCEPIATFGACLLTARGHPLARRAQSDFRGLLNEETLNRYPLIVAEVQLEGYLLKETFAGLRLPLNVGMEVGTFDTLKRYVARGLGIAVVSGMCVTVEDRQRLEVVAVPSELDVDARYDIVMRSDKHQTPLLKDLLRLIKLSGASAKRRG